MAGGLRSSAAHREPPGGGERASKSPQAQSIYVASKDPFDSDFRRKETGMLGRHEWTTKQQQHLLSHRQEGWFAERSFSILVGGAGNLMASSFFAKGKKQEQASSGKRQEQLAASSRKSLTRGARMERTSIHSLAFLSLSFCGASLLRTDSPDNGTTHETTLGLAPGPAAGHLEIAWVD